MNVLTEALGGLFRLTTRLLLLVAGAVFFTSLLTAGLLVAAAFTLWNLLRGRRPAPQDIFRFQRGRNGFSTGFGPGWATTATRPATADIVEGQAREVARADARLSGSR